MKSELFPTLRKELENSFGRKVISSRDCLQMVDDIYQKTGYTINANTLRRFFGLVKSNYSASPSTLSILLKYCGFNSPDELRNLSAAVGTDSNINKEEVHHFLVSLFKNLPNDDSSPAIELLIQQTVSFLDRNPEMIEKFQREIAATQAGQYYFERSVNMDRLNGYYGEGLRFYMRSRNTTEAIVFANSVLVLRYWLTNNNEMLENSMAAMSGITVNNSYPSHIMARFIAAKLFYAHTKGESIDRILADASRYYTINVAKSGNTNSDFELILAEALALTNHCPEAGDYIKKGKSRSGALKRNYDGDIVFGIWEKIINAKRSATLKTIINPTKQNIAAMIPTSPLIKRYYTLLYMRANSARAKKANYGDLITETGFSRLS